MRLSHHHNNTTRSISREEQTERKISQCWYWHYSHSLTPAQNPEIHILLRTEGPQGISLNLTRRLLFSPYNIPNLPEGEERARDITAQYSITVITAEWEGRKRRAIHKATEVRRSQGRRREWIGEKEKSFSLFCFADIRKGKGESVCSNSPWNRLSRIWWW